MSFRLLALPLTLIADAVSLGQAGLTHRVLNLEERDQELEAIKEAAQLKREQEKTE